MVAHAWRLGVAICGFRVVRAWLFRVVACGFWWRSSRGTQRASPLFQKQPNIAMARHKARPTRNKHKHPRATTKHTLQKQAQTATPNHQARVARTSAQRRRATQRGAERRHPRWPPHGCQIFLQRRKPTPQERKGDSIPVLRMTKNMLDVASVTADDRTVG